METLTMVKAERLKLDVLYRIDRVELTCSAASRILNLSVRQIFRLRKRFKAVGDSSVIHRARGGHSARADLKLRNFALQIYKACYADYGPTLFSEVFEDQHGIHVHPSTMRRWLIDSGLWKPESQGRRHREHRLARPRKATRGMMLQLDGSTHDWFEGRNPDVPMLSLLVLIDDASNRTMLRLHPREDTEGIFRLLLDYFRQEGLPQSIYMDHGTVYWTEGGTTQFQRAMKELGIECIYAHSPQAKGRVERANRTHQDRLVKALRRKNISTIDEANHFLQQDYTPKHNLKFAFTKGIEEKGIEDVHRSAATINLEEILSIHETRVIRNDYTVTIGRIRWQILKPEAHDRYLMPSPGASVVFKAYLDGSVHIYCDRQELRSRVVTEREAMEQGMNQMTGRPNKGGTSRQLVNKQLNKGELGVHPGPSATLWGRDEQENEQKTSNFALTQTNLSQALAHGNV